MSGLDLERLVLAAGPVGYVCFTIPKYCDDEQLSEAWSLYNWETKHYNIMAKFLIVRNYFSIDEHFLLIRTISGLAFSYEVIKAVMVKMVMSFCCFSLLVLIVHDYHESPSYISGYIKETHIVASWVKSNEHQIIFYMNTQVSCVRNLAWQFQLKNNTTANLKSTLQWL